MSMIPDICTMYILLAAATTFEIQPVIDFLKTGLAGGTEEGSFVLPGPTPESLTSSTPDSLPGLTPEFLPGSGHTIDFLITGVGSIAITHSLMRQIGRRKPDMIIQAGIAGCFTSRQPGEVVVIREESLADLGVWEEGRFNSLFDLKLEQPDTRPFRGGLLVNPYKKLLELSGLEPVRAITVNEISTDRARIEWIQQNTAPVVESMEGGGLHYVCLQENIPFLQLRSVSNVIGERDKTKWNIKAAITSLNNQLMVLFKKLAGQDNNIIGSLKETA
jgi:futalosine hydrolase